MPGRSNTHLSSTNSNAKHKHSLANSQNNNTDSFSLTSLLTSLQNKTVYQAFAKSMIHTQREDINKKNVYEVNIYEFLFCLC